MFKVDLKVSKKETKYGPWSVPNKPKKGQKRSNKSLKMKLKVPEMTLKGLNMFKVISVSRSCTMHPKQMFLVVNASLNIDLNNVLYMH